MAIIWYKTALWPKSYYLQQPQCRLTDCGLSSQNTQNLRLSKKIRKFLTVIIWKINIKNNTDIWHIFISIIQISQSNTHRMSLVVLNKSKVQSSHDSPYISSHAPCLKINIFLFNNRQDVMWMRMPVDCLKGLGWYNS